MPTEQRPKAGLLALGALVLAGAAFAGDIALVEVPAVRNGWWMTIPLAVALVVAIVAVARRRRWTTIVPAVLVLLMAAGNVFSHVAPTPEAANAVKAGEAFPDVELAGAGGAIEKLSTRWAGGPLVVVLFRGPW